MTKELYTVQEVANLLGLHVKTVRNYVREGRLASTRVGKQYRITRSGLEAFTGTPLSGGVRAPQPGMEVSSVLQMDGVGADQARRLSNFLVAASKGHRDDVPLRVETLYDEERSRLKVITLGSIDATITILEIARKMGVEE